jgi:hypothetical protein
MPKKRKRDLPESKRIYRFWVELRDLRDGSTRDLPLSAVRRIHLLRKKGEQQQPNQQVLRLQDDSVVLEGRDIDDIAAQLRQRYPDDTHERFLHRERDQEAEQRTEEALNGLIQLLAKAAVDEVLREQKAESGDIRSK